MILFFFSVSSLSGTDGEWRAVTQRLDARGGEKSNLLKGCIRANYDELGICLPEDGQVSLAVNEGSVFPLVATVVLQL